MARQLRITGDDLHYHIIARCNNGERFLEEDADCQRLLEFLRYYSEKYSCHIHNFVIMPSHVHLMVMTSNGNTIDMVMHDFCLAVARDYNWRHKKSGHFWRHRYRSRIITNDRYALACLRYIHRNPLAAGLVHNPSHWPWSAYQFYAHGHTNDIVTPHPSYLLLGRTNAERQESYRHLIHAEMGTEKAEKTLFEGNWYAGSQRFKNTLEKVTAPMSTFIPNLVRYDSKVHNEPGSV